MPIAERREPCKLPHREKRHGRTDWRAGLGHDTSATRAKNPVNLGERPSRIIEHEQQPSGDHGVHAGVRPFEGLHVRQLESTVVQAERLGACPRSTQLRLGPVDPHRTERAKSTSEPARVEPRPATELQENRLVEGRPPGPQESGDPLGIVAEEVLPAERVQPPETVEEAVGGGLRQALPGAPLAPVWLDALAERHPVTVASTR